MFFVLTKVVEHLIKELQLIKQENPSLKEVVNQQEPNTFTEHQTTNSTDKVNTTHTYKNKTKRKRNHSRFSSLPELMIKNTLLHFEKEVLLNRVGLQNKVFENVISCIIKERKYHRIEYYFFRTIVNVYMYVSGIDLRGNGMRSSNGSFPKIESGSLTKIPKNRFFLTF